MRPSASNQTDHPRNPNYERDIDYVTKHNKWILSSIGIWPVVLKGARGFIPTIAIGLNNLALFFTAVQCILHIVLEQKDPLLRLRIFGLACFLVISMMKYCALMVRRSNIEYCIRQVQTDWKQVELQRNRELMLKYGKMSRNLTIYSAIFMYSGGLFYHTIMQYTIGSYVDEYNRTIKLLIYPTYSSFYDVQTTPAYEIVYALQCMCGYIIDTVTTGVCGLATLFATHACGQIHVIISQLNDLIDGKFAKENSNPNVRLIEIVKHHIRILRFSKMVETVLQEVCFLEFVGTTFVMCLLQYYCIVDWEQNNTIGLITYTLLLISLSFNMFLLCYIGNLLIEKTSNVGEVCYMLEWYNLPTQTIKGLMLIIVMSNRTAKISAGGIIDLSLPTYGDVIKTSFAYLNFLRTMVV